MCQVLDGWFGPGEAVFERDVVEQYRAARDVRSGASYGLITFPGIGNGTFGILTIRGTITAWDWLSDARLWVPAKRCFHERK